MLEGIVRPDGEGRRTLYHLRYREQLREAVQASVRAGAPPSAMLAREYAARFSVPDADRDRFQHLVVELLLNLNEGSAARYGLRPSEVVAWRDRARAKRAST